MAEEHIVLESDGTSKILLEDGTGFAIVGETHEEPAGGLEIEIAMYHYMHHLGTQS